jgi:hypothetical protein
MEGQNENDELYPIAVLIDELKVQIYPTFGISAMETLKLTLNFL